MVLSAAVVGVAAAAAAAAAASGRDQDLEQGAQSLGRANDEDTGQHGAEHRPDGRSDGRIRDIRRDWGHDHRAWKNDGRPSEDVLRMLVEHNPNNRAAADAAAVADAADQMVQAHSALAVAVVAAEGAVGHIGLQVAAVAAAAAAAAATVTVTAKMDAHWLQDPPGAQQELLFRTLLAKPPAPFLVLLQSQQMDAEAEEQHRWHPPTHPFPLSLSQLPTLQESKKNTLNK